jgi:type II secretory pathway component GspD/PulD (secretin)
VIKQIDSGTTLNVRPVVSADRQYVYLEVHPLITNVTFEETEFQTSAAGTGGTQGGGPAINTIQLPITTKQELSVTVCVPDKGVLIIGGLGTSSVTKTSSGTPILSKIPIIKRLFSSNKIDRKSDISGNLIILIKPTILIRKEEETRAFTKRDGDIRHLTYGP